MKKSSNHHTHPLPSDLPKRIEMVVAACIGVGHVNRHVLAQYYKLSQIEASSLLRDFLHHRIQDVRWDAKNNSYTLVGYPTRHSDA